MGTVESGTVYPKGYFSTLTFHGQGDEAIPVLTCEALLFPHDTEMWHRKLCPLCLWSVPVEVCQGIRASKASRLCVDFLLSLTSFLQDTWGPRLQQWGHFTQMPQIVLALTTHATLL